jgi:imidazoleglycerol phosphate dehydratase HisB
MFLPLVILVAAALAIPRVITSLMSATISTEVDAHHCISSVALAVGLTTSLSFLYERGLRRYYILRTHIVEHEVN